MSIQTIAKSPIVSGASIVIQASLNGGWGAANETPCGLLCFSNESTGIWVGDFIGNSNNVLPVNAGASLPSKNIFKITSISGSTSVTIKYGDYVTITDSSGNYVQCGNNTCNAQSSDGKNTSASNGSWQVFQILSATSIPTGTGVNYGDDIFIKQVDSGKNIAVAGANQTYLIDPNSTLKGNNALLTLVPINGTIYNKASTQCAVTRSKKSTLVWGETVSLCDSANDFLTVEKCDNWMPTAAFPGGDPSTCGSYAPPGAEFVGWIGCGLKSSPGGNYPDNPLTACSPITPKMSCAVGQNCYGIYKQAWNPWTCPSVWSDIAFFFSICLCCLMCMAICCLMMSMKG
jgi:hypothetical protein